MYGLFHSCFHLQLSFVFEYIKIVVLFLFNQDCFLFLLEFFNFLVMLFINFSFENTFNHCYKEENFGTVNKIAIENQFIFHNLFCYITVVEE